MTHKGRMLRGEFNFKAGKLLDNEDTKYYLANVEKKEVKEKKPKKKKE